MTESEELEELDYRNVRIFTHDLKDIHAKENLQQVVKVRHDQDNRVIFSCEITINHDYASDSLGYDLGFRYFYLQTQNKLPEGSDLEDDEEEEDLGDGDDGDEEDDDDTSDGNS